DRQEGHGEQKAHAHPGGGEGGQRRGPRAWEGAGEGEDHGQREAEENDRHGPHRLPRRRPARRPDQPPPDVRVPQGQTCEHDDEERDACELATHEFSTTRAKPGRVHGSTVRERFRSRGPPGHSGCSRSNGSSAGAASGIPMWKAAYPGIMTGATAMPRIWPRWGERMTCDSLRIGSVMVPRMSPSRTESPRRTSLTRMPPRSART